MLRIRDCSIKREISRVESHPQAVSEYQSFSWHVSFLFSKNIGNYSKSLKDHFRFYNHNRPHQLLDYKTPAEIYFENLP
jgi:transposase InsO family protein